MADFKLKRDERLLDDAGWQILQSLQENARISFAELGRMVGLSSPAVAERVRKLEDAGILTGYHATLDVSKLGLPITALVRITNPTERDATVTQLAQASPEVLECHRITGQESHELKVMVSSVEHLERLIGKFEPYGKTTTCLVLSSPIAHRVVVPPEE